MNEVRLFDRQPLYDWLQDNGGEAWLQRLAASCEERYRIDYHGLFPQWEAAWKALPEKGNATLDGTCDAVAVRDSSREISADQLRETLMNFHPWRKGPFQFFDVFIDTEWRSDWKWARIAPHLDLQDKSVLDVGCGNGYYGWRMLAAGASFVLGCEPLQLYNYQFEVFRKYSDFVDRHFVVPITDDELPTNCSVFDVVFSMGVLYHRTSPIDHLRSLKAMLKRKGQLVMETLVIESNEPTVLVPKDRYAKMRNVWFIPSIPMLELWLKRCGFGNIRVADVSKTSFQEQRKTDWMTYESLESFLDPNKPELTAEGYPRPVRATVIAESLT